MDSEGTVIGKPGRSVKGFKKATDEASAYVALKAKKTRTPAEEAKLIGLELGFGKIKADEARKRADALKLDDDSKKALDKTIETYAFEAELEVMLKENRPKSRAEADAMATKLGPELWKHYQAGKRPTEKQSSQASGFYYQVLMQYGLKAKLPKPARAGYDGIERIYGSIARARGQLDMLKKQVEALESGQ